MKTFVRGLAVLALPLIFAACSKRPTTVEEAPPPAPEGSTAATAEDPALSSTGLAPAVTSSGTALPAGKENPLLSSLSKDERTLFEEWFTKYKLTPDPEVMDQDLDGDGYSNREEFLADTNPRDAKSLPGVMEAASLKTVNEVTVPLILREVKGSTARVERTDTGDEEQLVSGAQPKGLPYKVTGVKHEVKADKHGVLSDVSNVTLLNTATRETVVLIRDLPARSTESHAIIVGPNGGEKRVHLDETIVIPGMPGREFKVIEMREDQVLVEDLASKRALSIPKR